MTLEKVKEIIVETVNCDADAVVMDAKLSDDLGIDSLDAMEINMALKKHLQFPSLTKTWLSLCA